jgi:signal transduction histidine kinase
MAERHGRVVPASVRARTTLAAVLVVGVAMCAASVALVWFVGASLTSQVRSLAEARAAEVANGAEPTVVDPEEEFVQVLDGSGRIVSASPNVGGRVVVASVPAGGEAWIGTVPGVEGPFLVVAGAAPDGRTVLVGRSMDDVNEARGAVVAGLAIGVPILLALVGAVTWTLVGRALRPVDVMRAEAERISERALDRRLPDPGSDDEVGRLARTLNRMLTGLEAAQVRQRRFVSDASHELRSPVAAIRQHAEVARTHPDAIDGEHLARAVLEEELRLEGLIDDLLLLTRLDEGALPVRDDEVDLDDLAMREAARLRRIGEVEVDARGVQAARVSGSGPQLERVLRNLGDNAVRHARREIALGVAERDGQVVLTVDDDGPGIDEADRERAFGRFVRLDEGRAREAGGTGLGLAIVREIVAAHGGEVEMGDSPLGGLHVEVRLPTAGRRAPAG